MDELDVRLTTKTIHNVVTPMKRYMSAVLLMAISIQGNADEPKPLTVQTPASRVNSYQPDHGGILFDLYPGNAGPGKLTVKNGTNHNAICKIIDPMTNTKICSFVILANTTDGISGVLDGRFRVIFAYGSSIIRGTDRFESPEDFSEFKDKFDFVTKRTSNGIQYSTFSITLHKVIGGNARTGTISAAEYNKY